MEFKKKVLVGLASGALLLGAATPAFAAGTIRINRTGANSNNQVTVDSSNTADITSNNTTDTTNTLILDANTGNNSSSNNTGNGTVRAGGINGSADVTSGGDMNSVTLGHHTSSGGSATISTTGFNSNNTVDVTETNDLTVDSSNDNTVDNLFLATLNAGGNMADNNTGNGSVTTGTSGFRIMFHNMGNSNSLNF